MASFARHRSPVDDASTFAAQKEFKLLQLLSTDTGLPENGGIWKILGALAGRAPLVARERLWAALRAP